jgi:Ca2+-transporting ATPase
MIIAFVVGLLAQLAVTEIPFLTSLFNTTSLSFMEWICIILVSMLPLVMHEIIVFVKYIKKKNKS